MPHGQVFVFISLETTGLDTKRCEIIQMAAVHEQTVFNKYILPSQPIDEQASKVTGFTVQDGNLLHHQNPVTTTPLVQALNDFIAFLRSLGRPVLLVAHNANRFTKRILTRVLRQEALLDQFDKVVCGIRDTLLLSRQLFPHLQSHRLDVLVSVFLEEQYTPDGVEKAKFLQKLFDQWDIRNPAILQNHIF
ncbi:unnamed protein product [Ophioblennius macclurei]